MVGEKLDMLALPEYNAGYMEAGYGIHLCFSIRVRFVVLGVQTVAKNDNLRSY